MNSESTAVKDDNVLYQKVGGPITEAERDDLPGHFKEPTSEKQEEYQTVEKHPEPPNRGLNAWLTVLAGFFIYINTWSAFVFLKLLRKR